MLLAARLDEEAAFALGKAETTKLPGDTVFPRELRLEIARTALTQRLADREVERVLADGAAASVEDVLAPCSRLASPSLSGRLRQHPGTAAHPCAE